MGIVIFIAGELSLKSKDDNGLTPEQREFVSQIKNGWGNPAFRFLPNSDDIMFAYEEIDGMNPVKDGIEIPVQTLLDYAKKNDLIVNNDVSSTSDWSDFNVTYEIVDNELRYHDTQLYNTDDSLLIKELEYRGYTVRRT